MPRLNVTTKEALDAWKKDHKGTTTPKADEDTVIAKSFGLVTGKRLRGKDAVADFMKGAPVEVRDAAVADIEAGGDERISIPVVITDESVDRDDDVVVATGGDMTQYRRNNVMLFAHDHRIPAIGNGVGVHLEGTSWKGIAHFAPKAVHPFGAMIGDCFDAGIMKAISQGFIPLEWTYEEDRSFFAMKFLRWEMIEFSACNVGSNRNALAQARSVGIDVQPALDLASLVLDGADVVALPKAEALAIWKMLNGAKTFDLGSFRKSIESEHAARVKADRTLARLSKKEVEAAEAAADDATVIDWQGVAVMLGMGVGSEEFQRAKRANTFAVGEKEAQEANKTAAAADLAKLDAGEVKTPPCAACEEAKKTAPADPQKTTDPPADPAPAPAPAPPADPQKAQNADTNPKPGDDAAALTPEAFAAAAEKALTKGFASLRSDFGFD